LRHQASLKPHVCITHLAFDLSLRHESRDGVDHNAVNGAAAHKCLCDLQSLFTRVRLRKIQFINVNTASLGIGRVQRVLNIDERCCATLSLALGNNVLTQRRLARGLWAIDLRDSSLGNPADAQSDIERDTSGGNHINFQPGTFAKAHDGTFTIALANLCKRRVQRLLSAILSHGTPWVWPSTRI